MIKKLLLSVAIMFALMTSVNAQSAFEKGSLGVNLGTTIGRGSLSYFNPDLLVTVEYGLFPAGKIGVISLGGYASSTFRGGIYPLFGFQAAFHLGILKTTKFDVYAGLRSFLYGYIDYYPDLFIGGRFMFGRKVGIFAEVEGYRSNLKFGFTWIL